ncbi:MAG: hypothetical protein ACFWTI_00600 [Lactobacillus helveticus]
MKTPLKSPVIFPVKYDMATANELNNQIRKKYDNDAKKQALLIEYPTVYIINNTRRL